MEKLLLFAANKNRGLTLFEVLIATLIVVVFITVSLQALTVAALFKARGKLQIEAINWIQQDLENIRQKSSTLADTSKCKGATPDTGYAKHLNNNISTGSPQTKTISGVNYEMIRTPDFTAGTPSSGSCKFNACYEVLRLNYKIKGTGAQSGLILADVVTEVVPDAVFECPL